jgi:hypothetical protein
MEQIKYDNVINSILERFPEYQESERYYDELNKDLPYIVLGNLALMAIGSDVGDKGDPELAKRLIKFTDEVLNNLSSEDKLTNLFQVQVLEKLVGSREGARLAKEYLHGKSLEFLEQTLTNSNTKEFLEEYRK